MTSTEIPTPRSLHPPLVHIPIGAVMIAVVCDLVSVIGGSSHAWAHTWFKGGSCALIVGTAMLFVAAIAGSVDRSRATEARSPDRAAVNRHAGVMALLTLVCIADLVLRNNRYSSASHTPTIVLVLTCVALLLTVIGGELGGRLVYRNGIGVTSLPQRDPLAAAASSPAVPRGGTAAAASGTPGPRA